MSAQQRKKPSKKAKIQAKKQQQAQIIQSSSSRGGLTATEKRQLAELNMEIKKMKVYERLKTKGICPKARELISMSINPAKHRPVRPPDLVNQPTAIVKTRTLINVAPNTAAGSGADKGRFAVLVTPSLGQKPVGLSPWSTVVSSKNFGPTNASNGTSYKDGFNFSLSMQSALIDPSKTWDPSTAWDNSAFIYGTDSQTTQLTSNIGAGTGTWPTGYNSGVVREYRPVAQSAWFRCSESALNNGGNVACASVTNFMTGTVVPFQGPQATTGGTYADPGSLWYWENLANYPGGYDGVLKDGAYTWMVPAPTNLISPIFTENTVGSSSPGRFLMIAGQAQPDSSGAFPTQIGVIEVETVYEFTTTDQWLERKIEPFDACALSEWLRVVDGLPTAMSNDTHVKWYQKVMRMLVGAGAAGLTLASGGTAGPAIAAGLAAAASSASWL